MFSISWQDAQDNVCEVIGTQASVDSLYATLKADPNCAYIYCRETLSGRAYEPYKGKG